MTFPQRAGAAERAVACGSSPSEAATAKTAAARRGREVGWWCDGLDLGTGRDACGFACVCFFSCALSVASGCSVARALRSWQCRIGTPSILFLHRS
jgi:hypothetical protein